MNYPAPQYPAQIPGQPYPPQFVQQPAAPAYPQPVPQAPAAPAPVTGTLDDYYAQPTSAGGPGISWKDKPIGKTYAGVIKRDITNADIIQDTDFNTKQPKFYKDGRPVFVMRLPLLVNDPEFPEGEATFYVRGQSREELARAMAEAGVEGAPRGGDTFSVTLVERKPSRMGNPANIVRITYTPAQGAQAAAPVQQPVVEQAPGAQPAPAAQPVVEQQPLPAPAGLSPEQAQILGQLTGQQG